MGHCGDIARLDLNEYDFPMHPAVKHAVAVAVTHDDTFARYATSDDALTRDLASRLADRHGVGTENVLLTAGSDVALEYIVKAFGSMPVHVYMPPYTRFVQLVQDRETTMCEDWDQRPSPGSLVYVSDPNEATGKSHPLKTEDDTCVYIIDQAYAEFARDDNDLSVRPNVMYTRTFSKAFGLAGLRFGYVVGPAPLLDRLRAVGNERQVTRVAKVAATETLRKVAYYEEVVRRTREARRELERLLTRRGIAYIPSHANFLAIHVGPNVEQVAKALQCQGVYVSVRPDVPGYVRMSIGSPASMHRVAAALDMFLWLFDRTLPNAGPEHDHHVITPA